MTPQDRTAVLVQQYGECCALKTAALIISKSPRTIRRMIEDGRLSAACEGTMVDVRSIAAYVMAPALANYAVNRCRQRRGACK